MKANELMQGDIVLYEYDGQKFPARVIEIYRNNVLVESINGEYEPIEIEEDKIFPVSLTAEILEKNGFTRFGTDYILKERHFGLENPSIPSNYLDNYWLRVSIKAVHIDYVHQLQHALRLCGIEKEIEL